MSLEKLVLKTSVGYAGKNKKTDVLLAKTALNSINPMWGGPELPLLLTSKSDAAFVDAIKRFQRHAFGTFSKPDGRIDPKGRTIDKINQNLAGEVDIVGMVSSVMDESGAVAVGAGYWENEFRFDGVTDLVGQVLGLLRKDEGKRIRNLIVSSHGTFGSITLSSTKEDENLTLAQRKDPHNASTIAPDAIAFNAHRKLWPLRGKFAPRGLLMFSACNVAGTRTYSGMVKGKMLSGLTIDGSNLLKTISRALGNVPVQAGTDLQNDSSFGMEGNAIRCDGHFCAIVNNDSQSFWGPEYEENDSFWHHVHDDFEEELERMMFDDFREVADMRMEQEEAKKNQRLLERVFSKFRRKK